MGGCAGKEALIFSAFFNAALLGLFSQFYRYPALCHTHAVVYLTNMPLEGSILEHWGTGAVVYLALVPFESVWMSVVFYQIVLLGVLPLTFLFVFTLA